jgi:hypothetical protein
VVIIPSDMRSGKRLQLLSLLLSLMLPLLFLNGKCVEERGRVRSFGHIICSL